MEDSELKGYGLNLSFWGAPILSKRLLTDFDVIKFEFQDTEINLKKNMQLIQTDKKGKIGWLEDGT
jgi:hypothetical protein